MTTGSDLASTSLLERIVLYEVTELADDGESPVQAPALCQQCRACLDGVENVAVGRLTEADVARACRVLAERDLLERVEPDERSPVGKGRPKYDLATDSTAVRDLVREDDRLAVLTEESSTA